MYAVIKTGGKQYRVQPGDLMVVEKLDGDPGANVAFGEVLMLGDGDAITIGAPNVAGATVSATLIETRKGEKIKVFKKKRRQGYRRTLGHRQFETVLRVTGISGEGVDAKWEGEISLTTKAELNARARGLVYTAPLAANVAPVVTDAAPATKAAPKAKAAKVVDVLADPVVQEAAESAQVNAPVEAEAAPAKKPAAKKAAPKAEAQAEASDAPAADAKKPAAKKPAAKKDKGAE